MLKAILFVLALGLGGVANAKCKYELDKHITYHQKKEEASKNYYFCQGEKYEGKHTRCSKEDRKYRYYVSKTIKWDARLKACYKD